MAGVIGSPMWRVRSLKRSWSESLTVLQIAPEQSSGQAEAPMVRIETGLGFWFDSIVSAHEDSALHPGRCSVLSVDDHSGGFGGVRAGNQAATQGALLRMSWRA